MRAAHAVDKELAGTGIQAAHVAIDVSIGDTGSVVADIRKVPADQISAVYWHLHATGRDKAEHIVS